MVGTIDDARTAAPALRTPGRLVTSIAVPALCVLGFAVTLTLTLGGVRDGYQGASASSQATLAAAGRLNYDLADMDGKAAEILLVGDGSTLPQSSATLQSAYQADEEDADSQLAVVGTRLDGIPGGSAAFVTLETSLDRYTSDVAQAFYLDALDHGQAPARPQSAAFAAYQTATVEMHRTDTGALAAAQTLFNEEESAAESGYDGRSVVLERILVVGVAAVVLIAALLIVVQVRLARRFHRILNLPIALGTALTVIFGVLLFSALGQARDTYTTRGIEQMGVDWRNEAYGADMRASSTRRLLDIADLTHTTEDVSAEETRFQNDRLFVITQSPAFTAYLADDQSVRDAATDGTSDAGVANAAAIDLGQADRDFAKYVSDVNASVKTDSGSAAAAAARGASGLLPWLWLPSAWAVLMLLAVLGGIAPRLREYRAE